MKGFTNEKLSKKSIAGVMIALWRLRNRKNDVEREIPCENGHSFGRLVKNST